MSDLTLPALDYKALVRDDRIHASLYTDPRIFEDELEQIFYRGWIFVGHDSEIPRTGDFITRSIGTQPVIMVRGKDGGVAVLVNRCMHRGTMVCAASRGHARTFSLPVSWLDVRPERRAPRCPLPRRLHGVRQEHARPDTSPPRRQLSRLRLRELQREGHLLCGAPRRGHEADRPLLRPVAGGPDRALRRLGEASLRRQLEDAARERQRRLSPGRRAPGAVQDRPQRAVPARGRRRARHQGGCARLGQRAHRDRLVSGLSAAIRMVRRGVGISRRRVRGRDGAALWRRGDAAAHHAGSRARPHLPEPLPRRDQHRDRRAAERGGVRALAHADVPRRRAAVQPPAAPHGRGGHGPGVVPDAGGSHRGRPQPGRPARAQCCSGSS